MREYERFALIIDSEASALGSVAVRLLNLGVDLLYAVIDPRVSLYLTLGDWFPGLCLLLTMAVAVVGLTVAFRRKR